MPEEELLFDSEGKDLSHPGEIKSYFNKSSSLYNRFSALFESSDDAIIIKDLEGKITAWNKSAEILYGYSAGEIVGRNISVLFTKDNQQESNKILDKLKNGIRINHYETVRLHKSGANLEVSISVSPINDKSGKIVEASSIARDISERKKFENEKKEKEKQLKEAHQIAKLGYWEWDIIKDRFTFSDDLAKNLDIEYPEENLTLENFMKLVYPEDKEKLNLQIQNAVFDQLPFEFDYRLVLPNHVLKSIFVRGEAFVDDKGNAYKLRGISQDITERKTYEQRLESQFEIVKILSEIETIKEACPKILNKICDALGWQIGELWLVNELSGLLELEGAWANPLIDAKEFLDTSTKCKFGVGVSLQGKVWEKKQMLWSSNVVTEQFFPRSVLAADLKLNSALSFPIISRNKVLGVFSFYKQEKREPDTELLKMLEALSTQIAEFIEHKKTQPLLAESQGLYQTLVETSPDAITLTDLGGRILFCNNQAAELFGFKNYESLINKNFYAFIADEDQQKAIHIENATIELGKTRDVEYTLIKKDGIKFQAEINTSIVLDPKQHPKAFIEIIRDITTRKEYEDKIIEKINQQAAISEFGQFALTGVDQTSLFDFAIHKISDTLKIEYISLLEFLPNENQLILRAALGWDQKLINQAKVSAEKSYQAGFALNSKEPIIVKNLDKETRFKGSEYLYEEGIVSGISVVIIGRDKPFGTLSVVTKARRNFSKEDAHFLQAMANIISSSLEILK